MKKTTLLLSLVTCVIFTLNAQTPVNNFTSENNKVAWKKVIESEIS
jgi:hypothetical protein